MKFGPQRTRVLEHMHGNLPGCRSLDAMKFFELRQHIHRWEWSGPQLPPYVFHGVYASLPTFAGYTSAQKEFRLVLCVEEGWFVGWPLACGE